MDFEIKNGIVELPGFDIGNKILISDADQVTYEENGEQQDAKSIKVIIEIETLADFINENCDELADLGINVW